MCKGSGQVMVLSEEFVFGDRRGTLDDDRLLHAAAAGVMKGVLRSELRPFFRRLAEEGVWDAATPYKRFDEGARDMLLFGCWARPGHGTFLKSPKGDPAEVGAWLRWDGLFQALWSQVERSTDARWKVAIKSSRSLRTCPSCEGTGLAPHAKLLRLADLSLHEWIRDGRASDLYEAVRGLRTSTPRQKRTQERCLACLTPLVKQAGPCKLREPVEGALARELGRRVVEAFTVMPVVLS